MLVLVPYPLRAARIGFSGGMGFSFWFGDTKLGCPRAGLRQPNHHPSEFISVQLTKLRSSLVPSVLADFNKTPTLSIKQTLRAALVQ
jgi:hypothetical protein